jgi:hypothetical protein
METVENIVDLIGAAKANAKVSEDRISDVMKAMGGQVGSNEQIEELREATVALELIAVDTFSLFEARMQHHFKRGPFARKLKAKLLDAGKNDLAHRFQQYYLAVNVLKHGTGASFRELRNDQGSLFVLRGEDEIIGDETSEPVGLVDVSVAGFFDGLNATILDAYKFLEGSKGLQ